MDTKTCADCKEVKPYDDFGHDSRMASGRKSYCNACLRRRAKESYARDPERERKLRAARYKARVESGAPRPASYWPCKLRQYGITPEDYDRMFTEQDGRCAICRSDRPNGRGVRFHVDHDHKTGRVRALLCHSCNVGLGHLGDSIERLQAVISYLERHIE